MNGNCNVRLSQLAPRLGDLTHNLDLHLEQATSAAAQGIDLLVFPELSLSGYILRDLVADVALSTDEAPFQALVKASQKVSLVVGFVERSADYRLFNSAAYLENGEIVHIHRKVYLPTYGMFEEGRYFGAGHRFSAFNTRFGRFALALCEDMWHPSTSLIYSQDGSEVLIVPSASPSRGVSDPTQGLWSAGTWEAIIRLSALFYGQYVLFCNRTGYEDGINFWGGSQVVEPDGERSLKLDYLKTQTGDCLLREAHLRRARVGHPVFREEQLEVTLAELSRIHASRYPSGPDSAPSGQDNPA